MLKIVITQNDKSYLKWLKNVGIGVVEPILEQDFLTGEKADLVVFTGGQDITPSLYKDTPHHTTYSHTERDLNELKIYAMACKQGIPKLGICRGSQFLTALQPDGFLIQNIKGHGFPGFHPIIDIESNKEFEASSTHHQMMYPYNVKGHVIIAKSAKKLSEIYQVGSRKYSYISENMAKRNFVEPEIVFYNLDKALCIQGHPEFYEDTVSPFPKYCKDLIKKFLLC